MVNKALTLIACIALSFSGCSQNSLEDKRKATILQITDCIVQNDTLQLYKLIDTSFDKEGLDFDLAFLNHQLINNKPNITKNDIKLTSPTNNNTYYSIRVPIEKNDIKYIDINFSFSPGVYKWVNTINKDVENISDDTLRKPGSK